MSTRGIRRECFPGSLTVTLDPAPPDTTTEPERVIHIIVRCNDDLRDLILRFQNIFTKYRAWQDPLSQRISAWGDRVTLDLTTHTYPKETLIEKLKEHIQELAYDILLDPIGMVPMQEPLFVNEMALDQEAAVRNIVLDRETWNDYLELVREAFPRQAVPTQTPPSHAFAAEIVSWVKALTHILPELETTDAPFSRRPLSAEAADKQLKFMQLRHGIITEQLCQGMQKLEKKLDAASRSFRQLSEERESIRVRCELLRAKLELENARLRDEIALILRLHQQQMDQQRREIDTLHQQVSVLNQRVADVQRAEAAHNRAIDELHAGQARLEQQCSDLQRRARSKASCTIS